MSALTVAMLARVPGDGVADFQDYEARVLPLLTEHGGRLERRMRNSDGTLELHVVSFASKEALEAYRTDPRRQAAAPILARSQAAIELMELEDVH